jgi:hypothetical protein
LSGPGHEDPNPEHQPSTRSLSMVEKGRSRGSRHIGVEPITGHERRFEFVSEQVSGSAAVDGLAGYIDGVKSVCTAFPTTAGSCKNGWSIPGPHARLVGSQVRQPTKLVAPSESATVYARCRFTPPNHGGSGTRMARMTSRPRGSSAVCGTRGHGDHRFRKWPGRGGGRGRQRGTVHVVAKRNPVDPAGRDGAPGLRDWVRTAWRGGRCVTGWGFSRSSGWATCASHNGQRRET